MTTKVSSLTEINCAPGVEPDTDSTPFATEHWTFSDKIRFIDGIAEKIGGWRSIMLSSGATIVGVARRVFSTVIDARVYTIIGTQKKLYSLIGSVLTNITPLVTTTTAAANSIATHYTTLGNNPISVTNGSMTVTITDAAAANYRAGDLITLAGATTTGGILNTALNAQHRIRSVGAGFFTIRVGTAASSTTTGGGASVIRSSGLITVTAASHGMLDGDRVKIAGAASAGGITNLQINLEFIIRNVTAGTFDVFTAGTATSSVSGGGGASTTYQVEIADGRRDATYGQGYGMGRYGVGLYGVSKLSTLGIQFPRVWFLDHFGETVIATPGNQTGVYEWDGSTAAAPTLIPNAPTAINYAFVSDNTLITLGADGIPNRIKTSDQGDIEMWTGSSTNSVFVDDIETASRFISHVPVLGLNLLFTSTQVYTFRKISRDAGVWEIRLKDISTGIIGPLAAVSVNNVAYWMGEDNFYMWRGGNVEIVPSNSGPESTILHYVFRNIDFAQKVKSFAWYNEQYNEIWWHYPAANVTDPDRVARVCLTDFTWTPDTMERVAAESPEILLSNPRLAYLISAEVSGLYQHEVGNDDDTLAMPFTFSTNLRSAGKDTTTEVGVIPDSAQVGDINLNTKCYQFPQSTATTFNKDFTITPTTQRITAGVNGRTWMHTISGGALGQSYRMGKWQEYVQGGPTN